MNDSKRENLSEAGALRRDQMLKELKRSVTENHRHKQRHRVGATLVVLLTLASLAVWQFIPFKQSRRIAYEKREPPIHSNTDNRDDSSPALALETPKHSTPKRISAEDVAPGTLKFELVSNDEILDLLREVGKPSALAEINNEWVAIPLGSVAGSQ